MAIHTANNRVDWVDYAKGFCIVLVVMMHSTLGVEAATGQSGWMGAFVEFARPFRMPDFFMISGLFLVRVIDRPWRVYLDRKLVHFAYFYVLWVTIQFAVKAPSFAAEIGWNGVLEAYLLAFVQPFGTLWFIYVLPLFMVLTKVLHEMRIPWWITLVGAAVLHSIPVDTGSVILDESCSRFVFFFCGYVFATQIFSIAAWVQEHIALSLVGLAVWAVVNGMLVFGGLATLPGISLALGFLGALAVITSATLLASSRFFDFLRICGKNSIVIYLSFFFPMAVTRVVLLKLGLIQNTDLIAVAVTLTAVGSPLILYWLIDRYNFGRFLFERPRWAYIAPPKPASIPAE